jgi:LexA DNA binding domain.
VTPNQAAVFRVIEETIAANEIMPTGPQIAQRSGVKITSVNSALYQMQDAGIIDIANYGSGKRVVTIMATGAHTAHPDDAKRVREADGPSDSFAAIAPNPVVPCWQCGIRSDIGCVHQRWAA